MKSPWWCHQMEKIPRYWPWCREFTGHCWIPLTKASDLRLNKRLSKQSRRLLFQTPSRSLWRYCYAIKAKYQSVEWNMLFSISYWFLALYEIVKWTYLTHLPLDKMATISQTIFWYAFSWMKIFVFCHWSLFLGVYLTIPQHWFR